MNRYQPAEQVRNGTRVYLIIDMNTDQILPDWFTTAEERDEWMAKDNAADIPGVPRTSHWRQLHDIVDGMLRPVDDVLSPRASAALYDALMGIPEDVPVTATPERGRSEEELRELDDYADGLGMKRLHRGEVPPYYVGTVVAWTAATRTGQVVELRRQDVILLYRMAHDSSATDAEVFVAEYEAHTREHGRSAFVVTQSHGETLFTCRRVNTAPVQPAKQPEQAVSGGELPYCVGLLPFGQQGIGFRVRNFRTACTWRDVMQAHGIVCVHTIDKEQPPAHGFYCPVRCWCSEAAR